MARILLVEDDQWMADCYTQWLAAAGHNIRHARDAQTALDLLDDELPQLIVLDLLLPHANGVQLLHTLKSHADFAALPVILCSGSLPADMPPLAPYGIAKVLHKAALSPRNLQDAVGEALAHAAV